MFLKTRLLLFSFIATLIIMSPISAHAAYTPDFCSNFDALSIVKNIAEKTQDVYASSETAALAIADMYETAWPLTCFVGYGITNLQEAAEYLANEENNSILYTSTKGTGLLTGTKENYAITAKDLVEKMSGIMSISTTVYERAQKIGLILLIVFFILALAYQLFQVFIDNDEANPLDMAFLFIRFVTLAIIIMFLRPLIFLGLEASTLLRQSLIKDPITVVTQTVGGGSSHWSKGTEIPNFMFFKSGQGTVVTGEFNTIDNITKQDGTSQVRAKAHQGVDLRASVGTEIYAPVTGMFGCGGSSSGSGGIILTFTEDTASDSDAGPFTYRLMHLSECGVNGKLAGTVEKGTVIGKTGNSGTPRGGGEYAPHLHVEMRYTGQSEARHPATALDPDVRSAVLAGIATVGEIGNELSVSEMGTLVTDTLGVGRTGTDNFTLDLLYDQMMDLKLKVAYYGNYSVDEEDKGLLDSIKGTVSNAINIVTGAWKNFGTYLVVALCRLVVKAIMYFMLILADVIAAITLCLGPIIIAFSILPTCGDYLQHWLKSYITILFYQPLLGCFQILSFVLIAVSFDCGVWAYILMCVIYGYGVLHVPDFADSMSGTALVAIATSMAALPAAATIQLIKTAATVGVTGVGMAVAGPAGVAASKVASTAINKAADALNAVNNTAGDATSNASSKGGRSNGNKSNRSGSRNTGDRKKGNIKISFLCAILLLFALCAPLFATSTDNVTKTLTDAEKLQALIDVRLETSYPDKSLYESVVSYYSDEKRSFDYMWNNKIFQSREKAGEDESTNSEFYVDVSDSEGVGMLNGIYNTAYTNVVSLPVTRFILGTASIDVTKLIEMASYAAFGKELDYVQDSRVQRRFSMNKANLKQTGENVTALLAAVQTTIYYNIMYAVPIMLLVIMLLIQLAYVLYADLAIPSLAGRVNMTPFMPRFVLFLLLIVFFKTWAGFLITFSNYVTCAILPLDSQTTLIEAINTKAGMLASNTDTTRLAGWLASFFRSLTLLAIKILLIARDIFLALSLIVGPICIALGFFTRMQQCDPIHQFFAGWMEGFIKLLLWGPLAALMVWCLSVVTILTAMDVMSTTGIFITALAFLKAAGSLPAMADKMSGLMLASMLTLLAPAMMGGLKSSMGSGAMLAKALKGGGAASALGAMAGLGGRLRGAMGSIFGSGVSGGGSSGGRGSTHGSGGGRSSGGRGSSGGGGYDSAGGSGGSRGSRNTGVAGVAGSGLKGVSGTGKGAVLAGAGIAGAGSAASRFGGSKDTGVVGAVLNNGKDDEGNDVVNISGNIGERISNAMEDKDKLNELKDAIFGGEKTLKDFGERFMNEDGEGYAKIAKSLGFNDVKSMSASDKAQVRLTGLMIGRSVLASDKSAMKSERGQNTLKSLDSSIATLSASIHSYENNKDSADISKFAEAMSGAIASSNVSLMRLDSLNNQIAAKAPHMNEIFKKSMKNGALSLLNSHELAEKLAKGGDDSGSKSNKRATW